MHSIEIKIGDQKYILRGEEPEEHLEEVGELVRRKVAGIRKKVPSLSFHKATMLAAFDFASEAIKGRRKAHKYRSTILTKANELLERVQLELSSRDSIQ